VSPSKLGTVNHCKQKGESDFYEDEYVNSEATESGDTESDVNNLTFICCENCEQFDILIYHNNC